jgi:two-component system LytT family response regulator
MTNCWRADRLKRFLRDETDIVVIGECGNGAEAIETIEREKPDLVFLDVQMPEKNGFEVIKSLDSNSIPAVVFVTAYDQYALQAFDVHALDYLLKPFNRERFRRAVNRSRELLENRQRGALDERLAFADRRFENGKEISGKIRRQIRRSHLLFEN